jgi:autotransporter-associated beta strand protein
MSPLITPRPIRRRSLLRATIAAMFLALPSSAAVAQNHLIETGYEALKIQLGASLPTGSNVAVTQVEAPDGNTNGSQPSSTPTGTGEFANVVFNFRSPLDGESPHAVSVGTVFYGETGSFTPGITQVDAYEANNWLSTGVLKTGQSLVLPSATLNQSRVANHSYIGGVYDPLQPQNFSTSTVLNVLQRIDYLVERDDLINVVGMGNGLNGSLTAPNGALIGSNLASLLSYGANTISVGVSNLNHLNGTRLNLGGGNPVSSSGGDPVYGSSGSVSGMSYREHPRPDLVAPTGSTSGATPMVSSAAALLIDASRQHGVGSMNPWSTVDYSVRYEASPGEFYKVNAGDTSEVIRAALMAGADRVFFNSDGTKSQSYRGIFANQSDNGLDRRYGAGQLNVRNSYDVIAGKQHSVNPLTNEVTLLPTDSASGFDYDPAFGGLSGSNSVAKYNFTGAWTGQTFTSSLVWNVGIDNDGNNTFTPSAALYNLNLRLWDMTNPGSPMLVASSLSNFENTENIYTTLTAGKNYQLEVTTPNAGTFVWDYGIAWNGSSNQVWLGTVGNNSWNNNNAANWQRGNDTATKFFENDQVVFTDLAANKNVNITETVAPDYVIVNSTANYTFSGSAITGPGALVKYGSGTLTLNNANTYTGDTSLSAGRLVVNGSITSLVGIDLAGTLSGTGTIFNSVVGTGTVAPGNSIGTLHVTGSYNVVGTNDFEISKVGATRTGDLIDQVTVMNYAGILKITSLAGTDASTSYVAGDTWDLFNFASYTGQFYNNNDFGILGGGGNLPTLNPSLAWNFDYATGTLSVIPEPSTWVLASLGTLAAAWNIRQRRIKSAV